jgi:putative oxidoreductase
MSQKTKTILAWIVSGLLAFAFFGAGITKLIGVDMQIKNLESWGYPLWWRFPIGLSEMGMAVALLLPKFRKLAAYAVFPWMLVAVFTHLQAIPPQYEGIGGPVLFAILAAIILVLSKDGSKK